MDAGLVAAPTSAKPPTKHSKQSTDGKHFEEQGRKGSKQQMKLLRKKPQKRGKKKKEPIMKEGTTQEMHQVGWIGAGNGKKRCRGT